MTLAVYLQDVSPGTQPGPGVKKCQDPSLYQRGTTFENPPLRAPPASWVSNGSRRPNHCPLEVTVIFQRGSYLAIKSSPNTIQMKTSVGATQRLEAVVLISTQTSQAHTSRMCCLPRLGSRAGKRPGQKSSPAWSLTRWNERAWRRPWWCFLATCRGRIKALDQSARPKGRLRCKLSRKWLGRLLGSWVHEESGCSCARWTHVINVIFLLPE